MSSELTAAERAEIEAWADWHENHPPHTLDSDVAAQYVRRLLDATRAGEGLQCQYCSRTEPHDHGRATLIGPDEQPHPAEPSVEGLREAIAALKPASNLQGSPVNAYCMARDAALALIDAARAGVELDVERLLRIEAAALAFVAAEKAWTDSRLDTALGSVADEAAAALRAALHPDTAEQT